MTADPAIKAIAQQAAARYGIDADLVCAVIEQESSWDTYAIRFEPAFKSTYVDKLGLSPTESVARSISWGLMQTMGQTAYENGYRGAFPALCVPLNGIEYGCKILAHKIATNQGDIRAGLLAWNGGSNPAYPDEVLARLKNYD